MAKKDEKTPKKSKSEAAGDEVEKTPKRKKSDATAGDEPTPKKKKSEAAAAAGSDGATPKKSKKKEKEGGDKGAIAEAGAAEAEALKWRNVCAIAKPLADPKFNQKVLKLVKKAAKNKGFLRRGVKEVAKAIRKGERGVCVLGGDVSPIDVISHLPIVCEEANIPYTYVPSRADLGNAAITKRPTSVVLILPTASKGKAAELEEGFADDFKVVQGECQERLNKWLQEK
ncbi:hypothetical protein CLOM_g10099 [Closterium sp. NIES-68]|nr:hypothetical protein CLOM_g10099 [Closterium sp. NIES-68]GJP82667.1 hypothetical protein CLOP_g12921 [Closterium sp. NIES-67]GJP86793.1 hypothetical protein CLOP_g16774 [Closterium sp. NIES-67]